MAKNPWHKRYHANALGGYAELSLELRGAYTTLLDMMYDSGWEEGIEDRERKIAGHMDISIRKWRLIRDELIEIGKIEVLDDGRLSNKRYREERENAQILSETHSKVGVKGGDKSAETRRKRSKIKESGEAIASNLLHSLAGGREEGEGEGDSVDKSTARHKPSEPEKPKSEQPAIDPLKIMFDSGIALLREAGRSEAQARSILGKWKQRHQPEVVIVAISRARREDAAEPVSFIEGVLRNGTGNNRNSGARAGQQVNGFRSALREAEAAAARRDDPDD